MSIWQVIDKTHIGTVIIQGYILGLFTIEMDAPVEDLFGHHVIELGGPIHLFLNQVKWEFKTDADLGKELIWRSSGHSESSPTQE